MLEKKAHLQPIDSKRPKDIVWLGISFVLSVFASFPFIQAWPLRLILSIPAAFMLWTGLRKRQKGRRLRDHQEQYQAILSFLLSQASIGKSLEQALVSAHVSLSKTYPPRHPLNKTLLQVRQQIQANQTAAQAIRTLVDSLDCPEASIGLGMLTRIPLSGESLLVFLRQAHQSLIDLLEISREIAAQNAKTSAEAGILAGMPFVLTVLLGQSGNYLSLAMNQPVGRIVMGGAFLIAMAALSIILWISMPSDFNSKQAKSDRQSKRPGKTIQFMAFRLSQGQATLTGSSHRLRIREALIRIHGDAEASMGRHDVEKIHYVLAGVILGLLFAIDLRTPFVLPIPPIFLMILHDQLLLRQAKQEDIRLLSSFPFFLQTCVSLLEVGLTVHHVLTLVSSAFSQPDDGNSQQPMAREAGRLSQRLRAGMAVDLALDQMADQSAMSEIRAAYQVLGRYSRLGGQDLLQQLLAQTRACWMYYRNASRSQLDEQSMRMMLPMMLDLIVILAVSITPAVLMMSASF